jgi:alpha/beta superfamily hydrolase
VGATEGAHDEGRGETEDALAVIAHARSTAEAIFRCGSRAFRSAARWR